MSALLRRRLVCFYCGCRSAKKNDGSVRQWLCTGCDAVNYLDEKGDITDPPASATKPAVQYAHAIRRSPATAAVVDEGPFCAECILNQHLLTENLASYLPPTNDPDYATYEKSYPEYRKSLEERYPQVCIDCEPRVREKIRAAGYVARTDHLRRMMERSRSPVMKRRWYECGVRGVVALLGGLTWWGSVLAQGLWHVLGMMVMVQNWDGLMDDEKPDMFGCLQQGIKSQSLDGYCSLYVSALLRGALILGLGSFWWNNQLLKKLQGTGGRLAGLMEYYKLQMVVVVVRGIAGWVLQDGGAFGLEPAAIRGGHAFMVLFLFLSTFVSLHTVKIDRGPRISFPETNSPLVAGPSSKRLTPERQMTEHAPPTVLPNYLPIDKLAPKNTELVYNPPTPPPENNYYQDHDPDAMEWTPTRATFIPIPHTTPTPVQIPDFSSFSRLPPAPRGPAARLRNPQREGFFKALSSPKSPINFFKRSSATTATEQQLSKKPGDEIDMAPPQFFPASDYTADTGLETLFDAAFSMRDDPVEIRAVKQEDALVRHHQHRLVLSASFLLVILFASSAIALSVWVFSGYAGGDGLYRYGLLMMK